MNDEHTEGSRLRDVVAAAPMLDTVGDLRALLEQLPDDMPLCLDDHHRALPNEPSHDALTVHPSLVGFASEVGTPPVRRSGLMLTQVYVPSRASEEEQAAVASRDDLPAYGELARAADYLERGELRPGLKDVAEALEEVAHLVGEVAAGYVATGSESANALGVETERITNTAARVRRLANDVEAAE